MEKEQFQQVQPIILEQETYIKLDKLQKNKANIVLAKKTI